MRFNWDFQEARYEEGAECARYYDRLLYWRYMQIDPCWYDVYLMGGEL